MTRLVDALKEVGQTFELFQKGEIGPCESTPSPELIPNLVPSSYCRVPVVEPTPGDVIEDRCKGVPPAIPRELTYTQQDVIDEYISIPAQHSLVRLSKNPDTSADAVGMLEAVKSGQLEGIYCVNWQKSALRAIKLNSNWWTVIPDGEDAVLMLDPEDLQNGPPMIAFRNRLHNACGDNNGNLFPDGDAMLDAALMSAWQTYKLFRECKLVPCASSPSAIPVPNLVPGTICRIPQQENQTIRIDIVAPSTPPGDAPENAIADVLTMIDQVERSKSFGGTTQPGNHTIIIGQVIVAIATVSPPPSGAFTFMWSSSNPSIASVFAPNSQEHPNGSTILGESVGATTISVNYREQSGKTLTISENLLVVPHRCLINFPEPIALSKPARCLTRTEARDIVVHLVKQGAFKLHKNSPLEFNDDCSIKSPRPETRIALSPEFIDGVRFFNNDPRATSQSILGYFDVRFLVMLFRLARMLRTKWGVNLVLFTGLGSISSNANNHESGRAMDFFGVEGTIITAINSVISPGEYKIKILEDWGNAPLQDGNIFWPQNTGRNTYYRLDPQKNSRSDMTKRKNVLAFHIFRDIYKLAAEQCTDIGNECIETGVTPTTIGPSSRFIIHPDHPTPNLRNTHREHIHMQIGPTGRETNPPI